MPHRSPALIAAVLVAATSFAGSREILAERSLAANHAPVCDLEAWRPWWSTRRITGYFKAKGAWDPSLGWEGRTPRFYYLDFPAFGLDNPPGAGGQAWQDVTAYVDSGSPAYMSFADGFSKFSFALTLQSDPSQVGWLMIQLEGEGSTGIEQTSFIAGRVATREIPNFSFWPNVKLVWPPVIRLSQTPVIVEPPGSRPGGNIIPITLHSAPWTFKQVATYFETNDPFSSWTPRPGSKPKYWNTASTSPAPGAGWAFAPSHQPEAQPPGYTRRWNVDFQTTYDVGRYALVSYENVRIDNNRYWHQHSGLVRPIP